MDGMRLTRPTHSWIERVAAVMDAIALLHEARICVHSGFCMGVELAIATQQRVGRKCPPAELDTYVLYR